MIFVLGGYAQGKLSYVKEQYGIAEAHVYDGMLPESVAQEPLVVNHLNTWARKMYESGVEPYPVLEQWMDRHPDCILISDEIGNGIVPVEREERAFREWMGRLQIQLAKTAEEVIRVICGQGQKIK